MYITCLDMEGVLVPEIWIAFAEASGIPALKRTTRDEPDYHKLMEYRLGILREHGLGLREIQATIAQIDPLPGARAFLDELRSFTLLNERMLRYRDNVQLLRDRLTQAQQSYQAQLDYQLNKSMKTLSLVTTICLPLSLIAGWYGMNFTAMPELKWRYGYLYVIGLSAAVVSLTIILLKRKKG